MMNRKLAQGRHIEWLRTSAQFSVSDNGERADLQLKRSGKLVHRLLQNMTDGHDLREGSPWPIPGA